MLIFCCYICWFLMVCLGKILSFICVILTLLLISLECSNNNNLYGTLINQQHIRMTQETPACIFYFYCYNELQVCPFAKKEFSSTLSRLELLRLSYYQLDADIQESSYFYFMALIIGLLSFPKLGLLLFTHIIYNQ